MTDNERRALNGQQALNSHPTIIAGEDYRTGLIDLLTDLRHLAWREGWDWAACNRMAEDHFDAEVQHVAQG